MKNKLKIIFSVIFGMVNSIISDVVILVFLTATPGLLQSLTRLDKDITSITALVVFFLMMIMGGYIGYRISTANLDNKYKKIIYYLNYIFGFFLIAFIIINLFIFPDMKSDEFKIPNSNYSIVMIIESTHPYLAEYSGEVALREGEKISTSKKLFPDTGGYLRRNLYKVSDTQYQLVGAFDSFLIDISNKSIADLGTTTPSGVFLGAFDHYKCEMNDHSCVKGMYAEFEFIPASLRKEILYDFSLMNR